jgi:hypothetical protein
MAGLCGRQHRDGMGRAARMHLPGCDVIPAKASLIREAKRRGTVRRIPGNLKGSTALGQGLRRHPGTTPMRGAYFSTFTPFQNAIWPLMFFAAGLGSG